MDCPSSDTVELERFELDRASSADDAHSPALSSRGHFDSVDLGLTIGPVSSDAQQGSQRLLAEDPLLASSMEATSWDGVDATLLGSVDAVSDPLAGFSLANVSTQ